MIVQVGILDNNPDLSAYDLTKWEVVKSEMNSDWNSYTVTLDWFHLCPFSITSAQGKMMLRILGKREQVENIISQQPPIVQDYFRDGWDWERTSPIIWNLAPTIFYTTDENELNEALDDFFTNAALIK